MDIPDSTGGSGLDFSMGDLECLRGVAEILMLATPFVRD